MNRCTVCDSANLNEFDVDSVAGHYPIWWCEDCGSMHRSNGSDDHINVCRPEKSMLHHQVLAFHKRFGQTIGEKPHVPDEKTVRFRLSLIVKEFFELLEAAAGSGETEISLAREIVKAYVAQSLIDVRLPEFVDALADLDYVVEGTRITFGVDGRPIADEVQRANMDKIPAKTGNRYGGVGAEIVRPAKPKGWRGPEVDRVLIEQGWKP